MASWEFSDVELELVDRDLPVRGKGAGGRVDRDRRRARWAPWWRGANRSSTRRPRKLRRPRKNHKVLRRRVWVVTTLVSGDPFVIEVTGDVGRRSRYQPVLAVVSRESTFAVLSYAYIRSTPAERSAGGPVPTLNERYLARLTRLGRERAPGLGAGDLLVDIEGDPRGLRTFNVVVDRLTGVADLTPRGPDDDGTLTVPAHPVRLTLHLRAPGRGLVVSAAWVGFPGEPGSTTSVARVVAEALGDLARVGEFRTVSTVEAVRRPPLPGHSGHLVHGVPAPMRFPLRVSVLRPAPDGSGIDTYLTGRVWLQVDLSGADDRGPVWSLHPQGVLERGLADTGSLPALRAAVDHMFGSVGPVVDGSLAEAARHGRVTVEMLRAVHGALDRVGTVEVLPQVGWRYLDRAGTELARGRLGQAG